ncbi:hypothetical protein HMPREF9294_0713 [Porphyromonas asaccharolytica PR426713P-I]|uniref:hypothetical protein n=1 Tax=Porphyromonas asaccharolytica TaxID=28123 RepID=UPI0001EB2E30|nr:hypothetical protein [Porphyromonas asaccharolytica]EFR33887.1 hypothetical protein HMPREF9294_0713 [Porphyromonas asaccharolytica PR426713P-I]
MIQIKPSIILVILLALGACVACDEEPQLAKPIVVKAVTPLDYISEGNLLLEGDSVKTFFTYSEALTSVPQGTHVGSRYEWAGIIPPITSLEEPTLIFQVANKHLAVEEAIQIGDTKATYSSDYKNMGNGISYALRLAPAKAAAEEGFPPAQDKKLLAAYRYQVSEGKDGGLLTVTVRPLGESFDGTIEEVAKESFWAQDKQNDVERQFPFAGQVDEGNQVYVGTDGFYWTSTPDGDTSAYYVWIGEGAAGIFDDGKLVDNYRQMGLSVRPFADHL